VKVLIANNMAPFVWGGAEELARNLALELEKAGHTAEVLRLPFRWDPPSRLLSQILVARAIEISNTDAVIALKFPAYLIRHPSKTIWLLHQYRQAYDLWEAGQSNLPAGEIGDNIRAQIRGADELAFSESKRIFVNSDITRERLERFNGVAASVLLPPVNDAHLFVGGESDGYIFAGGRVNAMKRQHMLVAAVAQAGPAVKLVIAGPPDAREDALRLEVAVAELGLEQRVRLDLRFLSRREYAEYLNRSAAVAYIPFDEDSLGYVAMESATAGKPIITTTDSGGIRLLARHRETGWVAEPTAASLADAMTTALNRRSRAVSMGRAARELWSGFAITWPRTIEALTG
jgi:glycosyltransferase involved in cell wall biosynthesis